jgi:hypothetical protein
MNCYVKITNKNNFLKINNSIINPAFFINSVIDIYMYIKLCMNLYLQVVD